MISLCHIQYRIMHGTLEPIGSPEATLQMKGREPADNFSRQVTAPDHPQAVTVLMDWPEECGGRQTEDEQAAEAVAFFCYQAKKWLGGFAAALGGLDTLIFAGGIGENAPRSAPGFAPAWSYWASNLMPRKTQQMRR